MRWCRFADIYASILFDGTEAIDFTADNPAIHIIPCSLAGYNLLANLAKANCRVNIAERETFARFLNSLDAVLDLPSMVEHVPGRAANKIARRPEHATARTARG